MSYNHNMTTPQSLLFPLRAAQKVGLPITRGVLLPVIDQIIQHQRWTDALELLATTTTGDNHNNNSTHKMTSSSAPIVSSSVLFQNQDLTHRLITELTFPSSQWVHSLNFIKAVATSFPTTTATTTSPHHQTTTLTTKYSSVEEFFGMLLRQEMKSNEKKKQNNSSSSSSSFVTRIAANSLAPHGLWLEIQNLRRILETVTEEDQTNLTTKHLLKQQESTLRKFEMRALIKNGRWISATKCLQEIISTSPEKNAASSSQRILPYPDTVLLLKRLAHFNRWREGVNIFNICYANAINYTRRSSSDHHHHRNHTQDISSSNNNTEQLRFSDILGASICLIATSSNNNNNNNYMNTNNKNNHDHQWWQALKALSLVQKNLPEFPVTIETIEAASRTASPEVMQRLQGRVASEGGTISSGDHRSPQARSYHQNNNNNSNNRNNNNNGMATTDTSRAVSVITDLAKSNKWQIALDMLRQLNPKTTNKYGAGKCAGAIMVQMSKLHNWEIAFRVYTSVVNARARITRCTKLQESDQRALLFVCAEQRRWREAFNLLALAEGKGEQQRDKNDEFLFETKVDRYGIAFNSRPPWNIALQYARNAWSKFSSNETTRVAVLSGVAASALEHARRSAIEDALSLTSEGNSANSSKECSSSSSSLDIGTKLVERMFAQNLFPKGEVVALLPEKQALEVAKSGVVPLVEILLAIRLCGHGKQLLDEELVSHEKERVRREQKKSDDNNNNNTIANNNRLLLLGALNWSRSLKIAAAASEKEFGNLLVSNHHHESGGSSNSSQSHHTINKDAFFKLIKYCKASSETLLACSTTHAPAQNHQQHHRDNENANFNHERQQQRNYRKKHVDHYQHSLTFLSTLEKLVNERLNELVEENKQTTDDSGDQQQNKVIMPLLSSLAINLRQSQYKHQIHWEASLKIAQSLFDTIAVASVSNSNNHGNEDEDKNYLKLFSAMNNNSHEDAESAQGVSDQGRILKIDIRAIFSHLLHILSRVPMKRNFNDWWDVEQDEVVVTDPHRERIQHAIKTILDKMEHEFKIPYRWYIREHGPFGADSMLREKGNWQVTLYLLDYVLRCSDRNNKNTVSHEIDNPPMWPPGLRDCFFHCVANNHGNKLIAERGLKFYELMCQQDDALRDVDGKRMVELCAIANQDGKAWKRALQYMVPLQERNCLSSSAVSAFFYQFENQWLIASEMFTKNHRDAVFRSLFKQRRLSLDDMVE